jgi:hypothetical protein
MKTNSNRTQSNSKPVPSAPGAASCYPPLPCPGVFGIGLQGGKMNFCMCNSQEGYPHAAHCPYPYYGSNKQAMDAWQEAAERTDCVMVEDGHSLNLYGTWRKCLTHGTVVFNSDKCQQQGHNRGQYEKS